MRFPSQFAIVDRKVISQLGRPEWLDGGAYLTDVEIYQEYLEILKSKIRGKMSLREVERER
jgi:hypothetical protein